MTSLRQRMLEDMQVRNLSPHTQGAYQEQVSRFARLSLAKTGSTRFLRRGRRAGWSNGVRLL